MNGDAKDFDLLIIGGGINGAGIACDAAGRGLSVLLSEQGDLGAATSSASSKLIHGGLRYLEFYEFRLVRESLAEREIMLGKAPHIIHPLRFVLPHANTVRPAWMVRLGLFLYDHLGPHPSLPDCRAVDLTQDPVGEPLQAHLRKGFSYSDCWVDDARLVVLNAVEAARRGATIMTRTQATEARRVEDRWHVRLGDGATVTARVLVNAAGPWVHDVLADVIGIDGATAAGRHHVRLVKGSHLVVPRLHDGDHAYILQHTDRRVVFVLPFEGQYSLIGTTEVAFDGDPGSATMDPAEAEYLCGVVGTYLKTTVSPADAVWSFAGVRPLFGDDGDDARSLTRDYDLVLDAADGQAPLLSVFGGKITTYRRLAEQALGKIKPFLPTMGPAWTATAPLPGGDIPGGNALEFANRLGADFPTLQPAYFDALVRRHGTRAANLLDGVRVDADLGRDFGGGLREREIDFLMRHEWAVEAEDILWRRTKCGLHMDAAQRRAVAEFLGAESTDQYPGAERAAR